MSENYKGSIELISGLTQKNKGNFPLMEASAVAFYEDDGTEVRLPEKLEQIGISEDEKSNIIQAATSATLGNEVITNLRTDIDDTYDTIDELKTDIKTLGDTVNALSGDNEDLGIEFKENTSTLYLFEGKELILPDLAAGIEGNVISSTPVTGGGGGTAASYNLVLTVPEGESTDRTVLQGKEVSITYDVKLTSLEDPDTLLKDNVVLYLYVNDSLKKTYSEAAGLNKTTNITEYLSLGSNTIKLIASYTETIQSTGEQVTIQRTQRWYINTVNMYITSNYNDAAEVHTANVTYTCYLYGDLSKTAYFILDGELFAVRTSSASGKSVSVTIPMQSHGSHTLEVYCTAVVEEETIESEHLYYDMLFAESGNMTPIIRAVAMNSVRQQYTAIPIEYSVYQNNVLMSPIELKVISENEVSILDDNGNEILNEDGTVQTETVITEEYYSTKTVDRLEQTWNYIPPTDGKKTLTITAVNGGEPKTFVFEIEKFPYEISPVTGNLAFDFNPEGRTNQDDDYNIFNYNGIDWTLSDNFDWNNGGWQIDDEGNTFFCVKAGTSMSLNYNLFADANTMGSTAAQGNGKEFKIIFKTANVADSSATWLSCMAETEKYKPVGIQMDIHNGYVTSDINTLTIPYSEEDIIEFDMNIIPFGSGNEKDIPMIMTYEDGTPVQPIVIDPDKDATISFTQANPVPITIGSEYCDVYIYRMKAYSKFLSDEEVLNNFIADARTGTEKANRYLRNNIYNNLGQLTPEDLAEACPDLRIIKISCPRFTTNKSDKVTDTKIEMIYKNGDPIKDNWTAINCQHSGQGTSSNAYGFAGRNLDLIMNKSGIDGVSPIIQYKDGTTTKKITLTETSVPTNYLNVKVNIASSENANNALLQKRFNRYLPYTMGSAVWQTEADAKNSMEFYNCVIFVQERGYNDLTNKDEAHVEFNDTNYHFYAIGNVGDSKKTDSTRTSDPDDTEEFCVEIMDWNLELSNFPMDTKVVASKYTTKDDNGNFTGYVFIKEENLGKTEESAEPKLYEKQADGSYILTQDTTIDEKNIDKYYIDILENDDFSEDYTYGFRYLNDDEKTEQVAAAKAKWIEFYRFITRDLTTNGVEDAEKVAAWKSEFSDWFIEDAAFYYYLYTLRYTMVDNRAKNSFWHYGKVATINSETGALEYAVDSNGDFIRKFDFWDYDNDTALGIDNAGKLEMSYGVEDNDTDEAGATYFRAADSTFFQRLVKYFSSELSNKFRQYESATSNIFNSTHLINEFDTWQSQFPEELWRLDYERKYKRTYVNGGGDAWDNAIARDSAETRFLADMMNGKKKYQRRQFERNQDFYMSSKFIGASNNQDFIVLRGAGDISGTDLVVPQDATLHITPYLNMYINLSINNTGTYYKNQRCYAGQTYDIPYPTDKLEFNYIYGASKIQSLGDLSPMYLQTATLGKGAKLKEIILGNSTEGYSNNALSTGLEITSNNKLLEIFNIENLPSLSGSLPIASIPSVKEVYAQGTKISNVSFARNGLINTAYLPETVDTLTMIDLYYLNTLSLDGYDNLYQLVQMNTPNINEKELLEKAVNLIRFRVTDINWTDEEGGRGSLASAELLKRLLKCKGIAEDGSTLIDQSVLTGKVKVKTIRQAEIDAITAAWPDLELTYDEIIPQYMVRFWREKDADDAEPIYSILYDSMHQMTSEDDPSAVLIEQGLLVKEQTAQYTYTFKAWDPTFIGTYVKTHLDFYGTFEPTVRTYTVSWYGDTDGYIITNGTDKATVEVEYGTPAIYDVDKFGIPVKNTASIDNKYHLFKEWDISTGYVTQDIKVYPIWETSTTNISDTIESQDLSAIQLYALSNLSFNSGLGKFIEDGEPIKLQLGYMPDYGGITLIDTPVTFDGTGTNVIDTEYKLFDEDKSFVLAIDFTMGYSTTGKDNTLVSCGGVGALNRGIRLYSPYTSAGYGLPVVQWNVDQSKAVSTHSPSETKVYRDICVIRHVKGDSNLYVYMNNRYSSEDVQELIAISSIYNTISHTLCFGAQGSSTGAKSNYGTGTIHYAKLWFDDLGADECKKICAWTKDELIFRRCGTEAYWIPDSEKRAAMSFVADLLLEEPVVFDSDGEKYDGGWDVSDLRTWLNSKVFAGLSLPWQQLITPVAVRSLYGSTNAINHAESNGTLVETTDKLYIPAYAEMDSTAALNATYGKELSNSVLYSPIDSAAERVKTYPDGSAGFWWSRTPQKSTNLKQVIVDKYGAAGAQSFYEQQASGTALWYNYTKSESHGVLLAFSIGEVL